MRGFIVVLLGALLSGAARAQSASPQGGSGQTFPGLMNPSISVNGLFVGSAEWDGDGIAPAHVGVEAGESAGRGLGETYGTGLAVQEFEIQMQSAVDPYFRAVVVLAIPGAEGLEIEEGYVTLTSLPQVLVNVGKIKEPFGRENPTHSHALLTIDKSLIGQRVFGGEGLNDMTVNAAWLMPLPWFSELTLGVDRGTNDVVLGSGEWDGVGGLAHWKNLIDLSYTTAVEIGVSGVTGRGPGVAPSGEHPLSTVGGIDVTLQGHGSGKRQFNRIVWQNEYIVMDRPHMRRDSRLGGLYSTLEYSFGRRIWLGGRYDLVGIPTSEEGERTQGATGIFVLTPTEFSAFRVQAQHQWTADGRSVSSITSQLNFTIGAHPAHAY